MKTLIVNLVIIVASSLVLANSKLESKQIKVAVIDTGIDTSLLSKGPFCKEGHKDFTGTGIQDTHGHGTHVAGLIEQYAKNIVLDEIADSATLNSIKKNFCIIVIKFYDPNDQVNSLKNSIRSIQWAIDQNVDIINYSGGGNESSPQEKSVVIKALNKGIKFVAAAGNNRSNIDEKKYYPAMYDSRITIVGNLVKSIVRLPSATKDENVAPTSNWGMSVNAWEMGTRVLSRLPNGTFGYMTGTSQACAIKTGKIVREMLLKQ